MRRAYLTLGVRQNAQLTSNREWDSNCRDPIHRLKRFEYYERFKTTDRCFSTFQPEIWGAGIHVNRASGGDRNHRNLGFVADPVTEQCQELEYAGCLHE